MGRLKQNRGFTLVEVIIGMTLSLLVMGAVLSSYVFLARNFTRSLGISSAIDPNLEAQGRRALAWFTRDVDQAIGFDPAETLGTAELTLILPNGTASQRVTYYFNNTPADVAVHGITARPNSLTRINRTTTSAVTLHTDLLTNLLPLPDAGRPRFEYFDVSGRIYSNLDLASGNYLPGIKQVAMVFSSQVGSVEKQTMSQVYVTRSPRLILRNKRLLP